MSRRNVVRAAAATVLGAGALDAFALEPRWLDVTRHDVDVPDLPSELEGFTVAHVTDVHLDGIGAVHRAIADALEAARPDLVAVTGDVADADARVAHLPELVALLRAGGSRVVATLGNWEHWGGVNIGVLAEAYLRAGARLLANESVAIERGLVVVATDDSCSGFADAPRAVRDASPDRPRLFLSHAPGIFDDAPPGTLPRAALALSGHTHGGQVRALTRAIVLPPGSGRFVAGAYTTDAAPLYVSRGVGTSVIPARFACRPELPILRLRRGDRARIV
jgi:predicted MPP superfamily phosphohydrolase